MYLNLLYFFSLICIVYSLIRWDKRTISCNIDDCLLSKGTNSTFERAHCVLDATGRHECDIECDSADRDSVIAKFPNGNRKCLRFYSYNTLRKSGKWVLWRSDMCAQQKITFEVFCGVPLQDTL